MPLYKSLFSNRQMKKKPSGCPEMDSFCTLTGRFIAGTVRNVMSGMNQQE